LAPSTRVAAPHAPAVAQAILPKGAKFPEVWVVYSFKTQVSPVAYNSSHADATIIWLSGIDEPHSEFPEIQQAQSYSPDVYVTPYRSYWGDATIIWLSGMDWEEEPRNKVSVL